MNKKTNIIAILLCVGILSLGQMNTTYAKEDGRDVIVSYSPSDAALARYQLQVNIIGKGSVYDGSQEITKSTSVYSLKVDEEKTFRINPNKGYHIKSIFFDGNDITHMMKANGTITIKGLDHDSNLTFTYEQDGSKPKPENPDKPNEDKKPTTGPKTGDTSNNMLLMSMVLLSGAGIFFILWKKRREEEIEE